MDFGTLLFLGIVWLLFNLIGKARGSAPRAPEPPSPRPGRRVNLPDATQREGHQLETLLRELQRTLGLPAETPVRLERTRRPEAEEVEERESLEVEPETVSLEREVRRAERTRVDQDEGAERIETRRIASAAARGGALTRADHAAFDERIKAQPADQTAVRRFNPAQLRDAMVWREILGPPRSES